MYIRNFTRGMPMCSPIPSFHSRLAIIMLNSLLWSTTDHAYILILYRLSHILEVPVSIPVLYSKKLHEFLCTNEGYMSPLARRTVIVLYPISPHLLQLPDPLPLQVQQKSYCYRGSLFHSGAENIKQACSFTKKGHKRTACIVVFATASHYTRYQFTDYCTS